MKKLLAPVLFLISAVAFSQKIPDAGLKNVSPPYNYELSSSLSAEQRRNLVKQYRENFIMEDLRLPEAEKTRFRDIYGRYQDEQKMIKDEFNPNFDPDKLSDSEARQKLRQSFVTGQKLLDIRKKYAEEMETVLKPQQILKLFRSEGKMRDRFRENSLPEKTPAGMRSNEPNAGFRNSKK